VRNNQHLDTERPKLIPPHRSQRGTRRAPTVPAACPSVRQMTYVSIRAQRQRQRSTKNAKNSIIRMRHHDNQLQAHSASSRPRTARSASSKNSSSATPLLNPHPDPTPAGRRKILRCSEHGPISTSGRDGGVPYSLADVGHTPDGNSIQLPHQRSSAPSPPPKRGKSERYSAVSVKSSLSAGTVIEPHRIVQADDPALNVSPVLPPASPSVA